MSRHLIISYLVIGLVLFGLVMIGSASVVDAAADFGDKWYYLKLQSVWAAVGLVAFFFASRFPHQKLEHFASPLFLISLAMLILVIIPELGSRHLGARRWFNIGTFSFQPTEFVKLATCVYLSKLLKHKDRFIQFATTLSIILILIMLQPDMGSVMIIILTSLVTYFGSGSKLSYLFILVPVLASSILGLILLSPYRAARLRTFWDISHDPQGASYQIRQALIGLGSGGVWGMGLGQSRQKYQFLPEVTTDSIFAVIGEELGLVGTTSIVIVFGLLIWHGLSTSLEAKNPFSANLALAITSLFGIQALVNISAISALLPLTGVPLTFISYGGTALVISLGLAGILVNIARTNSP